MIFIPSCTVKRKMVVHDESVYYTFVLVLFSSYVFPIGIFLIYRIFYGLCKRDMSKFTKAFFIHFVLFCLCMYICYHLVVFIENGGAYFDPYDILQIPEHSSKKTIQRAYRKLSRLAHPDRNLNAIEASTKSFAKIAKAYEALIDPVGKRNYKKYGHPDGRQSFSMELGIPVSFESQMGLLGLYAIGFIALLVFILKKACTENGKKRKLLSREGAEFLFQAVRNDSTSIHLITALCMMPELDMVTDESQDETFVKALQELEFLISEKTKVSLKQQEREVRFNIIATLCYLHQNHLPNYECSEPLKAKILGIQELAPVCFEFMAHVARKNGWMDTCLEAVNLLPRFAQGSMKEDRDGVKKQQDRIRNSKNFASLPDVRVQVNIFVSDEDDIQCGDLLTCEVNLMRKHIQPGESAPKSATLYPWDNSLEEYYIMICQGGSIIEFSKMEKQGHATTTTFHFDGPRCPGTFEYEIYVLSTVYLDLNQKQKAKITVNNA